MSECKPAVNRPSILFVNLLSTPIDEIEATFRGANTSFQDVVLPLGLMYISAYLKAHTPSVRTGLLDFVLPGTRLRQYRTLDDFIRTVIDEQVAFDPDVVAVSLNLSLSYPFFIRVLAVLKHRWTGAYTIVGGAHATNETAVLLEHPHVDAVLRGEGEIAFRDFVDRFPNVGTIDGLYTKSTIVSSSELKTAMPVRDLDLIPYPDWDLVDMPAYVTGITRLPKRDTGSAQAHRMAEIVTSRGCPHRCTFCSSHTVHGRKVRQRSVSNIVGEIRELHRRFGVNRFLPEDDYFTANKKQTLALVEAVRSLDIPNFELQYPNGLSVRAMDEEQLDALISVGMSIAIYAIESGSETVQRRLIKKNCDLDKATALIKRTRQMGVRTRCFYILGFPGETRAQMAQTIAFAKTAGADWSDFFVATPLVGSKMYDEFVDMGVIDAHDATLFSGHYRGRAFDTPEISAAELNDLVYRANLECNFISNINVREGRWDVALSLFEDVTAKYPFHIFARYMAACCWTHLGAPEKLMALDAEISMLIATDARAKEMYLKYGDLLTDQWGAFPLGLFSNDGDAARRSCRL